MVRKSIKLKQVPFFQHLSQTISVFFDIPPLLLNNYDSSYQNTSTFLHFCVQFSPVQLLSHVQLFVTPWITAHKVSLSITNSQSLPKLMSIESVMPSNHLILCRLSPPAFNLSQLQSFQMNQFFASGGHSIGVSASASIFPMNIQDWFPLGWTGWISLLSKRLSRVFSNTTVQKHQKHNFLHSAFFIVQLSHSYMTTGKTIALTRQTFVGKVMSLLFNMLSRLVITFLPRSKRLLISSLGKLLCNRFLH